MFSEIRTNFFQCVYVLWLNEGAVCSRGRILVGGVASISTCPAFDSVEIGGSRSAAFLNATAGHPQFETQTTGDRISNAQEEVATGSRHPEVLLRYPITPQAVSYSQCSNTNAISRRECHNCLLRGIVGVEKQGRRAFPQARLEPRSETNFLSAGCHCP